MRVLLLIAVHLIVTSVTVMGGSWTLILRRSAAKVSSDTEANKQGAMLVDHADPTHNEACAVERLPAR